MSEVEHSKSLQTLRYTQMKALVIGINTYKHGAALKMKPLRWAIRDAEKFAGFLKKRLNVENICVLVGEEATRSNIIHELENLRGAGHAASSASGHTIVFFSGHGVRLPIQEGYNARNNTMPSLPSYDVTPEDYPGDTVDSISRRLLSSHLDKIAKARGSSITLILDCCYSAGIHRGEYSVRGVDPDRFPSYNHVADSQVLSDVTPRSGYTWATSFIPEIMEASHVLLAACSEDETAVEYPRIRHGAFTHAILRYLEDGVASTMTNRDLILGLDIPEIRGYLQIPHCGPQHLVDRLLFTGTPARASMAQGEVRHDAGGQREYVLSLGDFHGISKADEFDVYPSADVTNASTVLAKAVVMTVTADEAKLSIRTGSIPNNFFAVQTKSTESLRVFCPDSDWLSRIVRNHVEPKSAVTIVHNPCDAALRFEIGNKEYGILWNADKDDYTNLQLGGCIREGLPLSEAGSHLPTILHYASLFYHHFRRKGGRIFDDVSLELRYVSDDGYDYEPANTIALTSTPRGSDRTTTLTLPKTTNKNAPQRTPITLVVKNGYPDLNLFIYVFYMDPCTLEIKLWYAPYFAKDHREDAPLLPGATIYVGCNGSGVDPWALIVGPEKDEEIGWLKVFISKTPVNPRPIVQDSPFQDLIPRTGPESITEGDQLDCAIWEARNIELVHRCL